MTSQTPIYERPVELLQNLIRFDTTNPPGNERPCIEYINSLLKEAGFETTLVANNPERPNLITRLKGAGKAPPLLLYGHVDVVTTANQKWTHPPFEGKIVDGFIWGRGALDMKHGVAMYLAAVLKAKAEKLVPPGDVIFAALADEEAGDEYGARFLVDKHPGLFEGVKYALGEFGGFNMTLGGKRFYPIMIAEKQVCWMKATFRGRGGHGSMPVRGQAMAKLARALKLLDEHPLPVHITPPVRLMMGAMAKNMGGMAGLVVRQVCNPALTNIALKIIGEKGSLFSSLVRNTVSPTMLGASNKANVIPSEVTLGMDGRMVPGAKPEEMLRELHDLLGDEAEIEVFKTEPGPSTSDMGLFDTLGDTLRSLDPEGIPMPLVMMGVTDARFFSLLGIQTYGFTPVQLPDDFVFTSIVHAADERLPVAAMDFGTKAVYSVLQRFH